jgi:hypothetical protein
MAMIKIKKADGSWELMQDRLAVSFEAQNLTEEQKQQARENIGAGKTTLIVGDEEIELYTPIGT